MSGQILTQQAAHFNWTSRPRRVLLLVSHAVGQGFMSKVVLRFSGGGDDVRLVQAIDAFSRVMADAPGAVTAGDEEPSLMHFTERLNGVIDRRLVFQDRRIAAKFLRFWRANRAPVVGGEKHMARGAALRIERASPARAIG